MRLYSFFVTTAIALFVCVHSSPAVPRPTSEKLLTSDHELQSAEVDKEERAGEMIQELKNFINTGEGKQNVINAWKEEHGDYLKDNQFYQQGVTRLKDIYNHKVKLESSFSNFGLTDQKNPLLKREFLWWLKYVELNMEDGTDFMEEAVSQMVTKYSDYDLVGWLYDILNSPNTNAHLRSVATELQEVMFRSWKELEMSPERVFNLLIFKKDRNEMVEIFEMSQYQAWYDYLKKFGYDEDFEMMDVLIPLFGGPENLVNVLKDASKKSGLAHRLLEYMNRNRSS